MFLVSWKFENFCTSHLPFFLRKSEIKLQLVIHRIKVEVILMILIDAMTKET